jgi:hypothetical protein
MPIFTFTVLLHSRVKWMSLTLVRAAWNHLKINPEL